MDLAGTDDRKWKSWLSFVEIMPTFVSIMGFSLFQKKTCYRQNSQLLFRRFEQMSAHFRSFKKLKSNISENYDLPVWKSNDNSYFLDQIQITHTFVKK